MPELPEVQSVIDSLKEQGCLNKTITGIESIMPKLFKNCSYQDFSSHLINEKIKDITRKGKYLIFHLTNDKVFIVHLRMEGKMFFENSGDFYDKKHVLVRIEMDDKEIRYHDTRRFGTFTIYDENTYLNSKEISKLGLDPLEKEFDWKYLKKNIEKSNRAIKTALLDQENLSGIGNIYADEILFASKIHPETISNKLSDNDFKKIAENARLILMKAVENKGTTISTYFYKKEQKGEFQKFLKVHTKKDFDCFNCKAKIIKIKVNGRGTYLCPKCQKIKV
ncbi:MAG: DNA-formamidopyrimidine glycosylase [Malacoplasma sp.]|nr:DNA-formamidopyrimidine glycosylase [Malacoplasma sp.]